MNNFAKNGPGNRTGSGSQRPQKKSVTFKLDNDAVERSYRSSPEEYEKRYEQGDGKSTNDQTDDFSPRFGTLDPDQRDSRRISPEEDIHFSELRQRSADNPYGLSSPSTYKYYEPRAMKYKIPYPSTGILTESYTPPWLNIYQLHRTPSPDGCSGSITSRDFRKRKSALDQEEISTPCNSFFCKHHYYKGQGSSRESNDQGSSWHKSTQNPNKDPRRTSEVYQVNPDLPDRFNNPAWFEGYGCDREINPFYQTTSADYGLLPPNPHTMPHQYYPIKKLGFAENLSSTSSGMLRNRSLNIN